ncbi:MAG: FtsW/RodA/SpoVE family cell cycle protein [Clostridia bacterium]|nr:FtsW/RodA/SpoVE family cell cycle protein [Clostridia bacterium]
MKRKQTAARRQSRSGARLASVVKVFFFSAFLLLFLKDFAWQALALAAAVPVMIHLGTSFLPRLFPADSLLLSLVNFLCALGVLVLYATNPAYAYQQAMYYGVGLVAMVVCIYLVRIVRSWGIPAALMFPVSLGLLALPLVIGRETNGARNWFYVGGLSVQPSEIVKLSLLIILSYCMSRRKFFTWLIFAVGCLGLLMLQKDLGTALMYYGVTLLLYYASSSNLLMTLFGLMGGGGAAVLGYKMFAHVKRRVAIWRNPWMDYDNAGYQIIQSLMAIASGGVFGVGLGLGSPRTIPVYHTDFIYAVICEQFGVVFGLCVLLMYVAIVWRGTTIAMAARRSFHGLLAMGCTLMIGLQTFVIIGGVIKLIPLTGVTMPFVSYGGTSLVSSMCLAGLLQGVASLNEDDLDEDARLAMMDGPGEVDE